MATPKLLDLFLSTRKKTESICSFLETEDYVVQPIVDVSPPKWHLGHTTWFFEEFVLKDHSSHYTIFDPDFSYVFNSYYESLGEKVIRADRGNLSRPTVASIYQYRKHVTQVVQQLLQSGVSKHLEEIILIGIHHEKQHQELLITDIKYILGNNPLLPKYNDQFDENPVTQGKPSWCRVSEGLYEIGHQNSETFCYDNELGAHKVYLKEFLISKELVTNGDYLEFMQSEGYDDVLLWHAEGWDWKNSNTIKAPLYWHEVEGQWYQYTLQGLKRVKLNAPLAHISFYEAHAFAAWKGMRLPTEFEWEAAHSLINWGSRWEWTNSAYLPYPGYKKPEGAIGEYNEKFMVNQMVLRGSSVATGEQHVRPTYRNFFHPHLRWQFTGIRLVKDPGQQ